ncbi:hypothetical protein KUTeg_001233 [Tegillarca granosa]|uniref:Uncharacterized protein n=1 Tax=Tegillarca granosa TaxID=220873 RepID=A0ABQ9FYP2_TEGGR|nr:hypothetical protein KUTeg_001233 [Tegillarca granosa]
MSFAKRIPMNELQNKNNLIVSLSSISKPVITITCNLKGSVKVNEIIFRDNELNEIIFRNNEIEKKDDGVNKTMTSGRDKVLVKALPGRTVVNIRAKFIVGRRTFLKNLLTDDNESHICRVFSNSSVSHHSVASERHGDWHLHILHGLASTAFYRREPENGGPELGIIEKNRTFPRINHKHTRLYIGSFFFSKKCAREAEWKIKDTIDPTGYIALNMEKNKPAKKTLTPVKTLRIIKKRKVSGSPLKKTVTLSQTTIVPTQRSSKGKKISVENEVDRAVKYIKSRRYETGMEILLKNRTGAKKAFTHIIQKEVRKEMFKLLNNKSSGVRCEGTLSQIKIFNWNNIFQELKTECPMLTSTLVAATTSERTEKNLGP